MNFQERRLPIKLESLRINTIVRDGASLGELLVVGESFSSGSDTLVQVAEIDRATGASVLSMEGEAISVDPEYSGFDFIDGINDDGEVVFKKEKTGGWTKLTSPFRELEEEIDF